MDSIQLRSSSYLRSICVCCTLDPHYSPPHFVVFTSLVVERLFVLSLVPAVCRRNSAKPQPQMLRQLPIERTTPSLVFEKVGVDYAGPFYIKYGSVRNPTIVKAYTCVFVSLSVKAVHLELISDLTSEAFIACLRRFVARRGKPSLILSDHGTNFVGTD